jgi:hypothetical protein
MNRTDLLLSPSPQPLDLPGGRRLWVRTPTAKDLVDAENKAMPWHLVRFLCNEEGSPVFREDEEAEASRMPAWIATRVVEEVGKLMQPPPHASEAPADGPRVAAWAVDGADGESDCHGNLGLVGTG